MSKGSYVKLDDDIYYGIHPSIVNPDFHVDNYIILTELNKFPLPKIDNVFEYPIKDRCALPIDQIQNIVEHILKLEGNVYIACKGGHGRSGLITAAVYAKKYNKNYDETIKYVYSKWKKQRDMSKIRPNIRKLGSPQTKIQKKQLYKYITKIINQNI